MGMLAVYELILTEMAKGIWGVGREMGVKRVYLITLIETRH